MPLPPRPGLATTSVAREPVARWVCAAASEAFVEYVRCLVQPASLMTSGREQPRRAPPGSRARRSPTTASSMMDGPRRRFRGDERTPSDSVRAAARSFRVKVDLSVPPAIQRRPHQNVRCGFGLRLPCAPANRTQSRPVRRHHGAPTIALLPVPNIVFPLRSGAARSPPRRGSAG